MRKRRCWRGGGKVRGAAAAGLSRPQSVAGPVEKRDRRVFQRELNRAKTLNRRAAKVYISPPPRLKAAENKKGQCQPPSGGSATFCASLAWPSPVTPARCVACPQPTRATRGGAMRAAGSTSPKGRCRRRSTAFVDAEPVSDLAAGREDDVPCRSPRRRSSATPAITTFARQTQSPSAHEEPVEADGHDRKMMWAVRRAHADGAACYVGTGPKRLRRADAITAIEERRTNPLAVQATENDVFLTDEIVDGLRCRWLRRPWRVRSSRSARTVRWRNPARPAVGDFGWRYPAGACAFDGELAPVRNSGTATGNVKGGYR